MAIAKFVTDSGLKIGDVVEVRRIVMFGGDEWTAGRVISIQPEGWFPSFSVEALHGAFDSEGHDHIALQFGERGRTWR